tara:strand:- start:1249 stop:2085 length:837 start_codon:yes stop_codon:yes gene_type:complete
MPLDHQLSDATVTAPGLDDLMIFTDLDGTLLDHATYSYAAALPALERLRQLGIPLILASSKTAAEISPLREALGFSHCEAIVENGSGILEAGCDAEGSGEHYRQILEILSDVPLALRSRYQGFSDWSADEVAARTGLSPDEARHAKLRRFSEPGLWLGDEAGRDAFVASMEARGLRVQQGGRFLTLSFGGSKAARMVDIAQRSSRDGRERFTVALGDAENDVAMIEQARLGVIIPNPAHKGIPLLEGEASGRIIRAQFPGPVGWNDVLTALLDQCQPT